MPWEKEIAKKLLVRFRKTGEQCDKLAYNCSRKEYKQFIEAKKRDFRSSQVNSLLSTVNDSEAFWKVIRKHRGRKFVTSDISGTDWQDHFEKVLNAGVNDAQPQQDSEVTDDVFDEILDADITAEEVKAAIRHLKSEKADGIIGEIVKVAEESIVPFFVKYFNKLFKEGSFPTEWTKAIVVPLHKRPQRYGQL